MKGSCKIACCGPGELDAEELDETVPRGGVVMVQPELLGNASCSPVEAVGSSEKVLDEAYKAYGLRRGGAAEAVEHWHYSQSGRLLCTWGFDEHANYTRSEALDVVRMKSNSCYWVHTCGIHPSCSSLHHTGSHLRLPDSWLTLVSPSVPGS